MAHVVSERRARKHEKQNAEAVAGSEAGSDLRHRRTLLGERDHKSAALKELEEEYSAQRKISLRNCCLTDIRLPLPARYEVKWGFHCLFLLLLVFAPFV
jgi:hypothetical protein